MLSTAVIEESPAPVPVGGSMMSALNELIGGRASDWIGNTSATMPILLILAAIVFYAYLGKRD